MRLQTCLNIMILMNIHFYDAQKENDEIVIGIDIGTTYSRVGVMIYDKIEIIPNLSGNLKTPNYVSFTDSKILIGESAMNNIISNPQNTIFNVMRLIGVTYTDKKFENNTKIYPFKIVNNGNNRPYLEIKYKNETRLFAPEQILSILFKYLKQIAEKYLNQNITKCVITVPNDFYHLQRISLKDSSKMAGLDVLSMINSASAVALAYGYDKRNVSEKNIIVYDIGGGTSDISLILMDDGILEVIVANEDEYLGGEDFNYNLVEYFIQLLKSKYSTDITTNKLAILKLRNEIETAKHALSTQTEVKLEIENIIGGITLNETLTRELFEELNDDLFNKQIKLLDDIFKHKQTNKSEIHEIILVGGTSNIPKIQQIIREYFDNKHILKTIDSAGIKGACIQAAIWSDYYDYTKTNECVKDILLLDVTSHSIVIQTENRELIPIINKNSFIPTRKSITLTTKKNFQDKIKVKIYEGNNHKLLGIYEIGNIPPAPEGIPQIEAYFEIDANGILNVQIIDKSCGPIDPVTLTTNDNRFTDEEITKMSQTFEEFELLT